MQIVIEPQRICPCGKSYIPMSAQERADYDKAVRKLEEEAWSESQTKEALPPDAQCTDEPE